LAMLFVRCLKQTNAFRKHRHEPVLNNPHFFEVLQSVAHQIKSPASTVMWTAEKIKRNAAKGEGHKINGENYAQLADFLVEDVKTMRQQTDNILKLVQIQTPKFRERPLEPLLRKLVNHYRTVTDDTTEIVLEIDESITLLMDEELFKEAMINLLDNGLDAMPRGGKLRVSAVP
ncbi:MAG: HAMP domain-containing histidine kinase, partial [bacterium]|nr:HAMP domain-containing histidine kinase [bacterium]